MDKAAFCASRMCFPCTILSYRFYFFQYVVALAALLDMESKTQLPVPHMRNANVPHAPRTPVDHHGDDARQSSKAVVPGTYVKNYYSY